MSRRQHPSCLPACLPPVHAASGENILASQRTFAQQTLRKVPQALLKARLPEAFLEEAPLSKEPGACRHWFTLPNSLISGRPRSPRGPQTAWLGSLTLCHLVAVWPSANCLTFLSLTLHLLKGSQSSTYLIIGLLSGTSARHRPYA